MACDLRTQLIPSLPDAAHSPDVKEEGVMLLQSSGGIDAECEVLTTGLGHAEWQEVDRRLREYARHRSALDAAEAFDLVRAEQLKIYVSFGFVSLYEYMERVLGYKPHTARERMRVARALAALPEMQRYGMIRPGRRRAPAVTRRPSWDVEQGGGHVISV